MNANKFPSRLPSMLAFFLLYSIALSLGLKMNGTSGYATLMWPPAGIALAALLLSGYSLWPAIFLGAFAVNIARGVPVLSSFGIGVGNTFEALFSVFLLNRFDDFHKCLDRLKDVVGFIFVAAILCTFFGSVVGVTSLWLGNVISAGELANNWRAWWLGDMLGVIVVGPLLLVWSTRPWTRLKRRQVVEAILLILLMIWVCLFEFNGLHRVFGISQLQIPFILFPFTAWASVRFGQPGSVMVTFIVSMLAISGAAVGVGPFVSAAHYGRLFYLYIYIGVFALTGLILAARESELSMAIVAYRKVQGELQDAIQARDEFMSVASHELKTPLTILSLQIQLLGRTLPNEAPVKLIRSVRNCEKQSRRLGELLDILMDLTRIRVRKLDLHKETVNLNAIVKEAVDEQTAPMSQSVPSVTIHSDAIAIGFWDHSRIEQIVGNLLSNAIKYGRSSPIEITVQVDDETATAKLIVKDQGVGISPEMQSKIFERFERVQSEDAISGLGLGLYIVRQLVEAHGGTIRVQSEIDCGSTFTVELPVDKSPIEYMNSSSQMTQ